MKILLVIPKYNLTKKISYFYNFPMGLAYISAVLKKDNYDVDCLNLNHLYGGVEEILNKALDDKKYDLILTGGNTLIFSVIKQIIETIKKHPSRPKIILGGPIITSEPELMIKELRPDFGVIGEGEITIIELVKYLSKSKNIDNKNPEDIDGIVFMDNNKIIITKKRIPLDDINSLPLPDLEGLEFHKLLDHMHCNDYVYNHSIDYPRTYPLLASRGCPYNCSFCWHLQKYRRRSMKKIMEELRIIIKKYNINNINIYDDCFSIDKKWLLDFCEGIKKLSKEFSVNLKWMCSLTAGGVDEEMLKIMKDAGCTVIGYGFESFSPIVLKSMRKPATVPQMDKAFNATLSAGIANHAHLIFGDIAETLETARETLNHWKKYYRGQVGLGYVQPYPGSDLYDYCIKNKIIKDKLHYINYEMDPHNIINMTKMSSEDFMEMRKEVNETYSKYMKFVRPLSIKKTSNKIYEVRAKCPFCGKVSHYKNFYIENRLNYGYYMTCRHCPMRFFIVSLIQKIGYKHYSRLRKLKNYYNNLKNRIKKKTL